MNEIGGALAVLCGYAGMFLLIAVLNQRFVVYRTYAPLTDRPWTSAERWAFKWNPWFNWADRENQFLKDKEQRIIAARKEPPLPPHRWVKG